VYRAAATVPATPLPEAMLSPTSILALPQPQPVHGAELLPSQDTLPRVRTAPARPARTAPCSAANTYKRRKPTAAPALSPAGALAVPPSRLDGAQRHGDHAIVPVHACAHDAAPTPASATLRRAALPRPRWGAGARDPHARRPCKRSKPSAVHPLLQCLLQAARPNAYSRPARWEQTAYEARGTRCNPALSARPPSWGPCLGPTSAGAGVASHASTGAAADAGCHA